VRYAEHPADSPYRIGLDRDAANYVPLTPISFIERSADVFPTRTAWIHGPERRSYAEFRERCRRLASALAKRGVRPGDTVAVVLPNTPPMLEAHFAVPMAGSIRPMNGRRSASTTPPARPATPRASWSTIAAPI
jgi:fatty-acyl-CoA synthase